MGIETSVEQFGSKSADLTVFDFGHVPSFRADTFDLVQLIESADRG